MLESVPLSNAPKRQTQAKIIIPEPDAIDLDNVVYVRLTQLAQAQVVRAQTKAVLFHTWLYKKIKPCSGDALLEQLGHDVARAFWETSFASLMGAIG